MENDEEGLYVLESEDEFAWWVINNIGYYGFLTYDLGKATKFSRDERDEIKCYPIRGWEFKTVKEAKEDFEASK